MSEWISVKDRLPENGQIVDVYVPIHEGRRTSCYYIKEEKYWLWRCSILEYEVSHWMPLPEPPTESQIKPILDGFFEILGNAMEGYKK